MSFPTLAQLRTDVQARGFDGTAPANIDIAINSAHRTLVAARRWPFREATAAVSTTAGVASVTVTAVNADALHIEKVGTADDLVDWLPIAEFRELTDGATGTPIYWTRYGSTISLYPTPNAVISLFFAYIKSVPKLTADTDVSAVPYDYSDAVEAGAAALLAARQRDYASRDRFAQERDDAVNRMIRAYGLEQRQGGRTVRQTGIWD